MTTLALLILVLAGLPVFAVLALVALLGARDAELDGLVVAMAFESLADAALVEAIPLLTFSGLLMLRGSSGRRLTDLVRGSSAQIARVPGVAVGAAAVAALTFSGLWGGLLLVTGGVAILAGAGTERCPRLLATLPGGLLAPSLSLLVYAVVVRELAPGPGIEMHSLLLAGLLPGLLVLGALRLAGGPFDAWLDPSSGEQVAGVEPRERIEGRRWRDAWPELALIALVTTGLYSGLVSYFEGAALTAAWLLLVNGVFRRELDWSGLPDLAVEAAVAAGAILMLLGMAMAAFSVLLDSGAVATGTRMLTRAASNPLGFLFLTSALLLIAGRVLGLSLALVVGVPFLLPAAGGFGVDPLHFAVVAVLALHIGCAQGRSGGETVRRQKPGRALPTGLLPVALALLVVLIIWPGLATWLPDLGNR